MKTPGVPRDPADLWFTSDRAVTWLRAEYAGGIKPDEDAGEPLDPRTVVHNAPVHSDDAPWTAVGSIAWVEGEERVALIDTAEADSQSLLLAEPLASMWRALAEGPKTDEQLRALARTIVDDDVDEFVSTAIHVLSEASLITAGSAVTT